MFRFGLELSTFRIRGFVWAYYAKNLLYALPVMGSSNDVPGLVPVKRRLAELIRLLPLYCVCGDVFD
jgi:hypothetical protein